MIKLKKLTENSEVKNFRCSDDDLNAFINDDARNFAKELLAVTYVIENEDHTIAYFSLLNDKIELSDSDKRVRNRFIGLGA